MNIVSVAKQFWSNSYSCGISEALRRTAGDLKLISSYRSLDIYLKDLSTLPPEENEVTFPYILSKDPHWEVQEVFLDDLHNLTLKKDLTPLKYIQKRFGLGSRLFVVFDADNTGIALIWINEKSAYMPHIKRPSIQLPEKTVYMHSAIAHPAYRNHGIGTRLHQTVLKFIRGQGYNQSLLASYVKNNKASRWHLANGYKKWGRVFYFEWLGKARRRKHLTQLGHQNPELLEKKT